MAIPTEIQNYGRNRRSGDREQGGEEQVTNCRVVSTCSAAGQATRTTASKNSDCVPTSFFPIAGKIRDGTPWKKEDRQRNQKLLHTNNTLRPRALHRQSGGHLNTSQLAGLRGSKGFLITEQHVFIISAKGVLETLLRPPFSSCKLTKHRFLFSYAFHSIPHLY